MQCPSVTICPSRRRRLIRRHNYPFNLPRSRPDDPAGAYQITCPYFDPFTLLILSTEVHCALHLSNYMPRFWPVNINAGKQKFLRLMTRGGPGAGVTGYLGSISPSLAKGIMRWSVNWGWLAHPWRPCLYSACSTDCCPCLSRPACRHGPQPEHQLTETKPGPISRVERIADHKLLLTCLKTILVSFGCSTRSQWFPVLPSMPDLTIKSLHLLFISIRNFCLKFRENSLCIWSLIFHISKIN
jgi:hypothetical protein